MAFFQRLRDLFSPTVRYVHGGEWGVSVDNLDAAQLYRTQPNLRAVVSFLADNAAQVPLKVHERAGDNDRPRVTDSPAALLLKQPNPDMTPFEFRRWMYSDLLLYERFLALLLPSAETDSGWELRPIPNCWMVGYNGSSPFAPESIDVATPGNAPLRVPADRFVLFHGYDPTDPMRQYSRISALKETLHEQVESNRFRRQMWHRGGRFNAYLTRPKDVQPWSQDGFDRFKETWKASWAGGSASEGGGMPILEDGMEIRTVQFNSRDAQWADSVKLSREDVAGVFHVNPALIWPGSGQTYASARDNARALYNDTLAPLLMQATDRINMVLLPRVGEPANDYVVYDITVKTQGTLEERISALQTACGGPFMSREEVRALIDLPREPDGELIVPLNVVTGGLASNHDTDPTRERYNSITEALDEAERILGVKAAPERVERKTRGEPSDDDADTMAAAYRRFFVRQAKSVVPKMRAGGEWWNAERWDSELADDLLAPAMGVATASGERAVADLWAGGSASYDAERTEAYIRSMCRRRAEMVNATTYEELKAIDDGDWEEDSEAEKSTPEGVFENAEENRSDSAGAAFAAALCAWAATEAARQNRQRGENVFKTWVVTSGNPRASHARMDGETVQYDQPFSNGAQWPGDIDNLDVAEVANCRCVLDIEIRD